MNIDVIGAGVKGRLKPDPIETIGHGATAHRAFKRIYDLLIEPGLLIKKAVRHRKSQHPSIHRWDVSAKI